jgi:hypothetical protein
MLQGDHSSVQHVSDEDKQKSREAESGVAVFPFAEQARFEILVSSKLLL